MRELEYLKAAQDCDDCVVEWENSRNGAPDTEAPISKEDLAGLVFKPCEKHRTMSCGCIVWSIENLKTSASPCGEHIGEMFQTGGISFGIAPGTNGAGEAAPPVEEGP